MTEDEMEIVCDEMNECIDVPTKVMTSDETIFYFKSIIRHANTMIDVERRDQMIGRDAEQWLFEREW